MKRHDEHRSKLNFPPWYMTVPMIAALILLGVLAGILMAEAWGALTYTQGIDLSKKLISMLMPIVLVFFVGWFFAMARQEPKP